MTRERCGLALAVALGGCADVLGDFEKATTITSSGSGGAGSPTTAMTTSFGGAGGSGGETTSPCPEGQTSCEGTCFDTENDPEHCGSCERSCLGGLCSAGACVEIQVADTVDTPYELAIDDSDVYWRTANAVWRHSKDQNALTTTKVTPPIAFSVQHFALSTTRVFWAEGTVSDPKSEVAPCYNCRIRARAKTDLVSEPTTLLEVGGSEPIHAFAIDEDFVYVSRGDVDNRRIEQIPVMDGAPITLVSDAGVALAYSMAVFEKNVYWVTNGALMVNSTETPDAPMKIAKLNGGNVAPLAFSPDLGLVLWAGNEEKEYDSCRVWSAPIDGSQAEGGNEPFWTYPDCEGNYIRPRRVVIQGTHAYWWASPGSKTGIQETVLSNPQPVTVHAPPKPVYGLRGLAVDDEFVYWLQDGKKHVMKVAK